MFDSAKTLIFFTESFPFGTSETFIENEFPFLIESFERIFVVTTNMTDVKTRGIPDNVEIFRIPYEPSFKFKVLSLLNYFNPIVQAEVRFIKGKPSLKPDKRILSILLASYAKAMEVDLFLNNLIEKHKLDIKNLYLYCYWMNDITSGAALFKHKNPEVKAFCRVHRWDVYFETQNPPYLPFRNFIIGTLDSVYCISQDAFGYLQCLTDGRYTDHLKISRLGTFNRDKIVTLPNAGMLRIVSCSNMIPLKRVGLIIEALALITDIKIDWRHFGKGLLEQGLKALADERLSGKSNIAFKFMGQISNTEMLGFYKSNTVDLFINVSETEGIPVSIIEASSFGIAVIATLVGGVGEIVENGENGFLLDKDVTARDVANRIETFYRMGEAEKERIRTNAVVIWRQRYSAEKNYAGFVDSVLSL